MSYCARSDNGCVLWAGKRTTNGYGRFKLAGKYVRAHRMALEIHTGSPIPAGMAVCHKCDNPLCVNHTHLFLGTWKDNAQDALRKGRAAVAEKNGMSKLNKEKVACIRELASSRSMASLAEDFSVSRRTIWAVVTRRTWKSAIDP